MKSTNLPDNPDGKYNNRINLPIYREKLTTILNDCYAQDIFEIDELENMLEKVQHARDLDQLETIVDTLPRQFKQQYYSLEPAEVSVSGKTTNIKEKSLTKK